MIQLEITAENLFRARARVEDEYHRLFSTENKALFGKRIEKICKLLDTHTKGNFRSNNPQMIVHSIAEKGFLEGVYPTSKVDWNLAENLEGYVISVTVHAIYKGIEDTSRVFVFPVGESLFDDFYKGQEIKIWKVKAIYTVEDLMKIISISFDLGTDKTGKEDIQTWHYKKFGIYLPYNE